MTELAPTACFAPSFQLHFMPTGAVRACCWSTEDLGDIRAQRIHEIWDGARRRELLRRLGADDWSLGCEGCGAQVAVEGRAAGSPPAYFDSWRDQLRAHPQVTAMPLRMEFEISITCNLQCIQCSGANSSSIRLHREKRPPLPMAYGDQFFEDLRDFLPHLEEASFVGGEPFLGRENFRIWDAMREVAPHVRTLICTNGTQWNERVEAVLDDLDVEITVSLDGASAATFEAIRPGARFVEVMANLDRFRAHAAARARTVQVNHCLIPTNAHELPDFLLMAEARDLLAHVVVVRSPKQHSLQWLPLEVKQELLASWEARAPELDGRLERNRFAWERELARLRTWVAEGPAVGDELSTMVLMFPRSADPGTGPAPEAVERELASRSADGVVHRIVVDRDDRFAEVPDAFAAALGTAPGELIGRPAPDLLAHIARWEVLAEATDRVDASMRFGAQDAAVAFVPVRDADGHADSAWILVAFVAPAASASA